MVSFGPGSSQSAPIAPISLDDDVSTGAVPVVAGDLVRDLNDYKSSAMDGDDDEDDLEHRSPPLRAPSRVEAESMSSLTLEQHNATSTPVNQEELETHREVPRHRYLTDSDDELDAEQPVEEKNQTGNRKMCIVVLAVLVLAAASTVGAVCATGKCTAQSSPETPLMSYTGDSAPDVVDNGTSTLSQIRAFGSLRCGISPALGFSSIENGERIGMDVDMCRAVAAAIFGDPAFVTFVDVTRTDRFVLLNEERVDMLAARTTHTMERDTYEETTKTGFSFSVPYIFSGMRFGGLSPYVECADSENRTQLIEDGIDCSGLRVCVEADSIFAPLVTERFEDTDALILQVNSLKEEYARLNNGECNVIAGGHIEVAESVVRSSGFIGPEYVVGISTHAKEPVCLVTRETDPVWSDFVNWVLEALLSAEEQGVTKRLAMEMPQTNAFGPDYQDMFKNAVEAVGSYGEIFARNVAPIKARSVVNEINTGVSGLIYSLPFGRTEVEAPNPVDGSTLKTIETRGFLRCGIARRPVFASFDSATETWSGHDIDFCKAVSAAIFDGVTSTIVYVNLPATERFKALQRGDVDVLSRITTVTLDRDVSESETGVGFSFTQPTFYDGLGFSGIPPYGNCADRQDTTSTECADLKICVNSGTTFAEIVASMFDEERIVLKPTGDVVAESLLTGDCNAIAGGVADLSLTNVRGIGNYMGEYEIGKTVFSKEPLALVTRQDDPQWSAFCFWIVSAMFFAEEEGITSQTANLMPIVNLFGPLYHRMLRDAVSSVGNFGDIFERHAGVEIFRNGVNELNVNGQGPQHFPLPGIF